MRRRRFLSESGACAVAVPSMRHRYVYGTVPETPRSAIYAIRVQDELLDPAEIDQVAALMRDRIAARGESATDVVVVQGDRKETLALFGDAYSVRRVRDAMFNAAIRWSPIDLD